MTALVADVGGTNSRLALVEDSGLPGDVRKYRNDAFQGFDAVLARFLEESGTNEIDACAVAVAGPVTDGRARLTNRDWSFDAGALAASLPGRPRVRLVNDLAALGHALGGLCAGQLDLLRAAHGRAPSNPQQLVAGLGTGFNVCLTTASGAVIEAELGHASLPLSVAEALEGRHGDFPTCEDLFSGRSLPRLHGDPARDGATLVARAADGDTDAAATVARMARLLGLMTREMVFQYMPLGGIVFAGSVARGILGPTGRAAFLEAAAPSGPFADLIARVPLRLITDDSAALTGLARLASTA